MPESVRDRPSRSHEYLFMLTKDEKYYYDQDAVKEPRESGSGKRNLRTVWDVNTEPFVEAHFATFPSTLVEPCIRSSSRPGDFVLDPFFGSGTVGVACEKLRRDYVGIELHPDYVKIAVKRLAHLTRQGNGYLPFST